MVVRVGAQRGWRGGRPSAALILCLALPSPAGADEAREAARTVLFGSLDVGRSVFVGFGRKRALHGSLDESGPVFLLTTASGRKRERDSLLGSMTVRQAAEASGLVGYQWVFGRTFATAAVGPELDVETGAAFRFAGPDDRARVGGRLLGDVWSHPGDDWLVHATAIAGSAREQVWARLAGGFRVRDAIFVGPEAAFYRTETYYENRFGLHATGIAVGPVSLRLSGGWRWDEERERSGPYVGLSGHWRP